MTCARAGPVEAAKVLIAHGATRRRGRELARPDAAHVGGRAGHPDMIAMLVEAGADVNATSTIVAWERQRTAEPRDKWLPPGGLTPLLFAAREGCVECVKVLRRSGADVNVVDPGRHHAAGPRAHQRPLRRRRRAHRRGRESEHGRQGRPHGAVGRRGHAHDAVVQPARRRSVDNELTSMDIITKLLDHGAKVERARCTRSCRIAPSSIAAATACSAPARRRCCAPPRPATSR